MKNLTLRKKLQYSFLLSILISISLTTIFSLVYFYFIIQREADNNLRTSLNVAQILLNQKQQEVGFYAQNLASSKALQVLTDLDLRSKVSEYIQDAVRRNPEYHITVFDRHNKIVSRVGVEGRALTGAEERQSESTTLLLKSAQEGTAYAGLETIQLGFPARNVLAFSASAPILRDQNIVGILLVRLVLEEAPEVTAFLKEALTTEAVFYFGGSQLGGTTRHDLPSDATRALASGLPRFERTILIQGGFLEIFAPISPSQTGMGQAVLGLLQKSDHYVQAFINAIVVFAFIMLFFIGLSSLLVLTISRSIVGPLNTLVDGANRIAGGDLGYELALTLKDEIGKLSEAFNNMRLSLKDKITEIQTINDNLESTVKERTKTIESLLENMKKYLPTQLYDAILGGQRSLDTKTHLRKKLTIFFSDLVGFTSTTDSMEAEDLSELLNNYLDNMAKIASKWGGTIDKFIGDAIMVFFGDPEFTNDKDHALRAVKMALEMLNRLAELRIEWLDRGVERPLHMRIGINTGYVTVGNYGSENRMDYTIIGSNVNLASRFETAAKPDSIYISHETYSLIKHEIECQFVGELMLKGLEHPVRAYQVLRVRDARVPVEYLEIQPQALIFKPGQISWDNLDAQSKEELAGKLSLAYNLAKGTVQYIFDESTQTYKLENRKS